MSDKKKFYINGKWVSPKSNKSIKVINPATEDVVETDYVVTDETTWHDSNTLLDSNNFFILFRNFN